MTSERLFNSFIPPKNFYTPQNKFLATLLPATLHGVGVITKLYFTIFAAFKETVTLNLAQRSFKVIDLGSNRKSIYIFLLVVNGNLDPVLQHFRDKAA